MTVEDFLMTYQPQYCPKGSFTNFKFDDVAPIICFSKELVIKRSWQSCTLQICCVGSSKSFYEVLATSFTLKPSIEI